jgi:predicted nucleic acid-binding protein
MIAALHKLADRLSGCRGVLVDSSILLDLASKDPRWSGWSGRALAECADHAQLVINPIIYAEVSIGYTAIEDLEQALPGALYRREPLPWEAGFLAGKCYLSYRQRGGQRNAPLPDFYIGAHAAVAGLAILTRDPTRYRSYFPQVEVLAPAGG